MLTALNIWASSSLSSQSSDSFDTGKIHSCNSSVVSIFIAFGKEFPLLYDVMYRYFPMFNKFRIPVMIMMLVQFFTPILAGYGIISFVENRPKAVSPATGKKWKFALGGLAFGIFVSLIGASILPSSLFRRLENHSHVPMVS